jgi:hypothetical protein
MRNPNEATSPNKRTKCRTRRKLVPATSLLQIGTAAPVTPNIHRIANEGMTFTDCYGDLPTMHGFDEFVGNLFI